MQILTNYNNNDQEFKVIMNESNDLDTVESLTIDGREVSFAQFEESYGDSIEDFVAVNSVFA